MNPKSIIRLRGRSIRWVWIEHHGCILVTLIVVDVIVEPWSHLAFLGIELGRGWIIAAIIITLDAHTETLAVEIYRYTDGSYQCAVEIDKSLTPELDALLHHQFLDESIHIGSSTLV